MRKRIHAVVLLSLSLVLIVASPALAARPPKPEPAGPAIASLTAVTTADAVTGARGIDVRFQLANLTSGGTVRYTAVFGTPQGPVSWSGLIQIPKDRTGSPATQVEFCLPDGAATMQVRLELLVKNKVLDVEMSPLLVLPSPWQSGVTLYSQTFPT